MIDVRNGSSNYDTESVKHSRSKSKRKKNHLTQKEDRDDKMILNGIVKESLPCTWFHVQISNGDVIILATLSGKMRQNHIQILPGDKVIVEVSPYDMSRGRICRRL